MNPIENEMNVKPPRADLNQGTLKTGSAGKTNDSESSTKAGAPQVDGDSISLTRAALEISRLEETLNRIPDIDGNRVNELKTAIANGEYQIDTDRIVSQLLQAEKDLL
ncbi:MAG: flagellar biosynthesis anti-sigma factor FlgM [Porticoccaceae bacterium]